MLIFLLEDEDVIEVLSAIKLQSLCNPEWGLKEMRTFCCILTKSFANYFPNRALTGPMIILSVTYRKVKNSSSQSQPILWSCQSHPFEGKKLSYFRLHSGYIKVLDGNSTQIFSREGCLSNHTSSVFLEIAIQESQNVTVRVSLNNNQSYVRLSYGILKDGLHAGKEWKQ